ncbi:MAG: HEAT repeat domain-containing protein [Planctomycetota bacterium]|nr:HEAT repeat domain-containing protein [Planctomycetota bacterium]
MTKGLRQLAGMAVLTVLASCGGAIKPSFDSPEPAARNAAIVHAASAGDMKAVPDLVRMLESDDPATRMLAITALERLTGQTHGYVAKDKASVRREAVVRWQEAVATGRVRSPDGT